MGARERWLVYLLRFGGVLLSTAVLAMLLPDAWMAAIHRGLGLGEYPDAPLTSYLTRSLSALYAFHGGLLLALSTDVRRFRPLVVFFGWANLVLGVALTAIDLAAPMPRWWTLGEGPWIVLTGALILWLAAGVPAERTAGARMRPAAPPPPARDASHPRRLVSLALALALAAAPAAARELYWRELAVEARLDGEGKLWVCERHEMVFTGEWNGGERIFRLAADQPFELLGLWRIGAAGERLPLTRGGLGRVDHYDWTDRRTLRWRSRLPSDPPFDRTAITYLIEYRLGHVLGPVAGGYLLDHDFAFPDRIWPIARFGLELDLDPVWRPREPLATSHRAEGLRPGESFVVTATLEFTGASRPAGLRQLPPVGARAAVFGAAALAMLWMLVDFRRREAAVGRYRPPPAPERLDRDWLDERLFDLSPEEAGALWDRKVGPPEVAAILARWQSEGRLESEVVPRSGLFSRARLRLRLVAERQEFDGYDAKLLGKLFFGGRSATDTEAIRKHYRSSGFDPAATVRRGIEKRLRGRAPGLVPHKKLPGFVRGRTLVFFLAVVALMAVEALTRPVATLQLAMLLLVPLAVLYLLCGLILAHVYRARLERLHLWLLALVVPGALFYALMAGAAFFDRWLPGVDFGPQPGLAGTAALAALAAMVWSSLLNTARTRERPAGLHRRQQLGAARRLLAAELERSRPELDDRWMPYLLALGLGPGVDRWWRRFGTAAAAGQPAASSSFGGGSGGRPAWSGGGGAFGGAGASSSWFAAASSVAAGVARPSSGGSGGGGGGGSSGGGGGGGW